MSSYFKWNPADIKGLAGAFVPASPAGGVRALIAGLPGMHASAALIKGLRPALGKSLETHCIINGRNPEGHDKYGALEKLAFAYEGLLQTVVPAPRAFGLVVCGAEDSSWPTISVQLADSLVGGGILVLVVKKADFPSAWTARLAGSLRLTGAHAIELSGFSREPHVCAFFARAAAPLPPREAEKEAARAKSVVSANLPKIRDAAAGGIRIPPCGALAGPALTMNTVGINAFTDLLSKIPKPDRHWDFGGAHAADAEKPLSPLSPWHALMAVGSGLYSGILQSNDGRRVLVKGRIERHTEERRRVVGMQKRAGGTVTMTEVDTMYSPRTEIILLDITPGKTFGEVRHVF